MYTELFFPQLVAITNLIFPICTNIYKYLDKYEGQIVSKYLTKWILPKIVYVYSTPPLQGQFFKTNRSGWNLVFLLLDLLPYQETIWPMRRNRFKPFDRPLAWSETQISPSSIWTWLVKFISYNNSCYAMDACKLLVEVDLFSYSLEYKSELTINQLLAFPANHRGPFAPLYICTNIWRRRS